jgi:tRNA A-37 threonylcarbamoyl transferase component Bud32
MDLLSQACAHCGAELSPALAGRCPPCLLAAGLEPLEFLLGDPLPGKDGQPYRFGQYELLERIERGGMGVVYKARHVPLDRTVALKMIAEGELASDAEVRRFEIETKVIARLEHRNIVPIYDVGTHEGRHYFTMKLMEGGSLANRLDHVRNRPDEAVRLVETIAMAVHYGHQRGVLHQDLKPANLLLDAEGVPHVADFGLARILDTEAGVRQTGTVMGTPGYMAPEQADPRRPPLTVATDVYSLGVILYELLTGRLPFKARSRDEMLSMLLSADPRAPRAIDPCIPRDLEAICLKCLEKEPSRRYGSAEALAKELECYRKGEPIVAKPPSRMGRAWRWGRRHPLGVGLLVTLIWILLVAAVGAVSIARAQEADLRRDALRVNVYAARHVAGAVLFELAQYRQILERAAAHPELIAAFQTHDTATLQLFCKDGFASKDSPHGLKPSGSGSPFIGWFIMDTDGAAIARWPIPQQRDFLYKNYGWRDYFQGAKRLAAMKQRAAYVSRAFTSEANRKYTFALSAPVLAEDGTWLGVLMATVASDSTLGALRLNEPGDSSRTATLVSLTDRERGQVNLPADNVYAVLVHERLERGMPAFLDRQTARQLERALREELPSRTEQFQLPDFEGRVIEGYRDPVSDESGTWLAAFAPVGHTEFAVIVQTRENAVLAVNSLLARRIAWWSLPLILGSGLVWLIFGWSRYRSSPKTTR